MILSMTGFGKATGVVGQNKVTVTIKSLNSKQMDISTRIAPKYRSKEIELRSIITKKLKRGKVEFNIQLDPLADAVVEEPFKSSVILQYAGYIKHLCEQLNQPLPSNLVEILLSMPGTYKTKDDDQNDEIPEEEWSALCQLVESALDEVVAFRTQEGKMLENVFMTSITTITKVLNEVEKIEPSRIDAIRKQLDDRLNQINLEGSYDQGRFEQEIIYYIEKLDVNEERNRLRNHLDYFIETLEKEKEQGKKLGFIAQEIGREINTLGSKSNDVQMQQLVVQMKDELEQIKEQVLNTL
ncbi:YicC/YloC family endoribonuclease [Falsiporphyromonas endometrii]|uniref:YicC/YloC family endoribonuclease n=1 Tax=Falsiporphyromonas endometrii TaxID=1387297 RepID=A0ABV9K997_9PORP